MSIHTYRWTVNLTVGQGFSTVGRAYHRLHVEHRSTGWHATGSWGPHSAQTDALGVAQTEDDAKELAQDGDRALFLARQSDNLGAAP